MDIEDVADAVDADEGEWDEEEYVADAEEPSDGADTSPQEMKPELKKLYQQHPECQLDYVEQVIPQLVSQSVPSIGDQVDVKHRTYPFLTQYERTKIIGLRAKQLSKGSVPFVAVPKHITDVRDIARLELEQKRLPYILKRPLPNGTYEYWRLSDLLIL